jgi:hypothetical protein
MITVDYPPGSVDPVHRHDAHAFVYVLQGSIVMQVRGGKEVTLGPGQTFYEGPPFALWRYAKRRPRTCPCGQHAGPYSLNVRTAPHCAELTTQREQRRRLAGRYRDDDNRIWLRAVEPTKSENITVT